MRVANKHNYTGGVLMVCVAVCACLFLTRPVTDPPPSGIEVIVTKKSLPAMSVVTVGDCVKIKVSRNKLPQGQQTASLTRIIGRVLAMPVVEDQVLTESCFITDGTGVQVVAAIPEGMRAVTLNLNSRAVPDALFLYPGSIVDVLFSFKLASKSVGEAGSLTILSGVQVIAVNGESVVSKSQTQDAIKAKTRPSSSGFQVTLLVDQKQAEALQVLADNGNISLAVRNPLDKSLGATEAMVLSQGRLEHLKDLQRQREKQKQIEDWLVKSESDMKITGQFEVSFVQARYAESRPKREIEPIGLYCSVRILDPNLVLGISQQGTITQFENGKNEIIDVTEQMRPTFNRYQPLQYRSGLFIPSKTAKQSTIKPSQTKSNQPQWTDVLEPVQMILRLEPGLPGPESERIKHVKGYFYVLMAESIEYLDIPFKPTEEWLQLSPVLEIKVLEARSTEFDYECRIDIRPGHGWFYPGGDLPNRFPIDRQLLYEDGKPMRQDRGFFHRTIPPLIGGNESGMCFGRIEKIRFVIAVNASHHKIPFELEDVPLTSLPTASTEEPNR
jgi:Flp pilus assembly protein CpaB